MATFGLCETPAGVPNSEVLNRNQMLLRQCMKAGIDLLLVTPIIPEIFETLLMLECGLVNRLQVA